MRVSYRGEDAGYRVLPHIQSLSKELIKKMGNANAKMIYGEKEKKEFENAKQCHICEGDIKKNNVDHLENIHQWLQDMRLHNFFPSEKEVISRYPTLHEWDLEKSLEARKWIWNSKPPRACPRWFSIPNTLSGLKGFLLSPQVKSRGI